MSRVAGIDPGVSRSSPGGVVILSAGSVVAASMPLVATAAGKMDVDLTALLELLSPDTIDLVAIEEARPFPKEGVVSTATSQRNYGRILGALEALRIRHVIVPPKVWKAAILPGTPGKDRQAQKAAAVAYVRRSYPTVDLKRTPQCKKPSDGIAEALCLAEYAQRLLA